MFRRLPAALLFVAVTSASGSVQEVFAQNDAVARPITESVAAAAIQFASVDQSGARVPRELRGTAGRAWTTPLLVAMQATTFATQALDVHSTMKALNAGGVEANPVMSGVVKNKAAFIGIKAAMGAGFVYATHRMGKRNKVGAIVMAAAVNSAYLFVAHHNYKVARSVQ